MDEIEEQLFPTWAADILMETCPDLEFEIRKKSREMKNTVSQTLFITCGKGQFSLFQLCAQRQQDWHGSLAPTLMVDHIFHQGTSESSRNHN